MCISCTRVLCTANHWAALRMPWSAQVPIVMQRNEDELGTALKVYYNDEMVTERTTDDNAAGTNGAIESRYQAVWVQIFMVLDSTVYWRIFECFYHVRRVEDEEALEFFILS
jgi:hypothetical protein